MSLYLPGAWGNNIAYPGDNIAADTSANCWGTIDSTGATALDLRRRQG